MNDELIAKTPIGEIVVGISLNHDYPGIFVELRGEHLNDRFKEALSALLGLSILRTSSACRPLPMAMAMQMISRILLNTNTS